MKKIVAVAALFMGLGIGAAQADGKFFECENLKKQCLQGNQTACSKMEWYCGPVYNGK